MPWFYIAFIISRFNNLLVYFRKKLAILGYIEPNIPRSYSRYSFSASLTSLRYSFSNRISISVKSFNIDIPNRKRVKAAIYFVYGDPRRHINLRKKVITVERPNSSIKVEINYLLVYNPLGYIISFLDNGRSSYSSLRLSRSSSSSRSGYSTRAPSVQGVLMMP